MAELRAKRLLEVATYEVRASTSEAGGAKQRLRALHGKDKDGARGLKWKRTAPDAKDLETNKVQDALFAIGGVEVAEFVDKPGPPADLRPAISPALKVTLRFDGGKPPVVRARGEGRRGLRPPVGRRGGAEAGRRRRRRTW